ncbi:hypothetical protein SUGI_0112340 [Cryptomeria japonica]|uniref:RING-H2 finger protein ATL5 n=1 Tax=Cryptomeria japonica TaxID=3369 RepID=UPI00240892C3|nr:RING-H2 finger protein ATL5 [Cryptomeria japonica]GLJ09582.1 hypothetical protein SUGI_0112340 [Cryptomeria japonica]
MGFDGESRFRAENSLADELYNIGGKIMLAAIVVLFMVVLFILGLHIYARCVWPRYSRAGRSRTRGGPSRRRRLAFAENEDPQGLQRNGLEMSVIEAFPVFVYRSETHKDEIFECAVCLCEFGDNEKGRLLPKCNHSFHIECIDMWFGSNSTCPLCRSDARPDPVEAQECPVLIGETENPAGEEQGPAVSVTDSSSTVLVGLPDFQDNGCSVLRSDSNLVEESSSPKSIVVDIESRRADVVSSPRSFMADNQQFVTPRIDSSLKSPASRLQSLRKILGMSVLQSPDGSSHIEQGGPAKV